MRNVSQPLLPLLLTILFAPMVIAGPALADMDTMDEIDLWADISDQFFAGITLSYHIGSKLIAED